MYARLNSVLLANIQTDSLSMLRNNGLYTKKAIFVWEIIKQMWYWINAPQMTHGSNGNLSKSVTMALYSLPIGNERKYFEKNFF